jgi:hypothetical protein
LNTFSCGLSEIDKLQLESGERILFRARGI